MLLHTNKLILTFVFVFLAFLINTAKASALDGTPTLESFTITNEVGATIQPEDGDINQICQKVFSNRISHFIVEALDGDGLTDIASILLRVGGSVYPTTSLTDGTGVFEIYFPPSSPTSTSEIEILINDNNGGSSGWISTNRSFKIWNCLVSISGTLYDGTGAPFDIIRCNIGSSDFTVPIPSSISYGLKFRDSETLEEKTMSVSSPDYTDGGNRLYWGKEYFSVFSNFDGTNPSMRVPELITCQPSLILNNSSVDPYAANPSIEIDFSSIINNFPWYQVAGGGIIAKNEVSDVIPRSCTDECIPYISKNLSYASSSVISANSLSAGEGEYSETENWNANRELICDLKNYGFFYNEYYAKLGHGTLFSGPNLFSNIVLTTGGTGVVFVNGNVEIDVNNQLDNGEFLLLIVNGDINISETASRVDGILVANNDINFTGESNNQLNFQGSMFSKNNVNFQRGFETTTFNNKNPAVLVTYRPDFLFSMPGKLTKILTGWKEGI